MSTHSTIRAVARPVARHNKTRAHSLRLFVSKVRTRYLVIGGNIILLAVVVAVVVVYRAGQGGSQPTAFAAAASNTTANGANPLDQLSSADIAVSIANMTNLPERTAVKNQAESVSAELAVAPAESVVVSKPQVVATALKSRKDIQKYVTQSGDTVASIAAKFGVTSNSILWSNSLVNQNLKVGVTLLIPPVNGIVYTVKAGDTPKSLAAKYNSNADQITAYNDAEIAGLKPGELIIIPNGQVQQTVSSGYGSLSAVDFYPSYAGANGYDFGYCTWYVATQIPVPSNWGNASSWAYYAALSGWTVSSTPRVGAIAQTPYAAGGQGHVAIIKAISSDGSQIYITDMNGIAGWDRVGSAWEPTAKYQHFIYH